MDFPPSNTVLDIPVFTAPYGTNGLASEWDDDAKLLYYINSAGDRIGSFTYTGAGTLTNTNDVLLSNFPQSNGSDMRIQSMDINPTDGQLWVLLIEDNLGGPAPTDVVIAPLDPVTGAFGVPLTLQDPEPSLPTFLFNSFEQLPWGLAFTSSGRMIVRPRVQGVGPNGNTTNSFVGEWDFSTGNYIDEIIVNTPDNTKYAISGGPGETFYLSSGFSAPNARLSLVDISGTILESADYSSIGTSQTSISYLGSDGAETVQFIRRYEEDISGNVTFSDFDLDGNPYTVVGTVAPCKDPDIYTWENCLTYSVPATSGFIYTPGSSTQLSLFGVNLDTCSLENKTIDVIPGTISRNLAFSQDGTEFYRASTNGGPEFTVYDNSTGNSISTTPITGLIASTSIGNLATDFVTGKIYASDFSNPAVIYEVDTSTATFTHIGQSPYPGSDGFVNGFAVYDDRFFWLSATDDEIVEFDVVAGTTISTILSSANELRSMDATPEGQLVFSDSTDGEYKTINLDGTGLSTAFGCALTNFPGQGIAVQPTENSGTSSDFTRIYHKDLETNTVVYQDHDSITGETIVVPEDAVITSCTTNIVSTTTGTTTDPTTETIVSTGYTVLDGAGTWSSPANAHSVSLSVINVGDTLNRPTVATSNGTDILYENQSLTWGVHEDDAAFAANEIVVTTNSVNDIISINWVQE
jgi:hypothetical protein